MENTKKLQFQSNLNVNSSKFFAHVKFNSCAKLQTWPTHTLIMPEGHGVEYL